MGTRHRPVAAPNADDRAYLLERMGALLANLGWEAYVAAPVLQPTERHFPDAYTPDAHGVRTVARRLMAHAGLEGVYVGVDAGPRAAGDGNATECWLSAVADDRVALRLESIGPAEEVPLVLVHEVARARVALHDPHFSLDDEEEVAPYALGFGLLAAMGAHRYQAEGGLEGREVITRWEHRRIGPLDPEEACFLLAVQAVVRGTGRAERRAWRRHLPPNQADAFRRMTEELTPDAELLRERLGLPPRHAWPAPWAPATEPLPADGWRPARLGGPAEFEVDRVRVHRGGLAMLLGFVAAFALLGVAALVGGAPVLCAGLVGVAVLPSLAYRLGRSRWTKDECDGCGSELPAGARTCRGCGGSVVDDTPVEGTLAAVTRARPT